MTDAQHPDLCPHGTGQFLGRYEKFDIYSYTTDLGAPGLCFRWGAESSEYSSLSVTDLQHFSATGQLTKAPAYKEALRLWEARTL